MASLPLPSHAYAGPVTNLRIIPPRNGHSFLSIGSVGSGATSVVKASSYRYRAGHVLTGATEVLLDKNDEVVVDVMASIPQAFAVEGLIDGESHRTIIDRARLWRDGTRQICECKPDWAAFYRPRAVTQRLLGEAAAAALGWEYVPVVPETLGSRTFRNNVDRVYGARSVRVPDHVAVHASQLLADGPMKLGEFTARIHDHEGNAFSMTCAMMVRRIVEIDLEVPLGHSSLVRAAPPMPRGLPSIRIFGHRN
ncbi:hypothetical protein [Sphingomonas japonica]|uniref:Uncharacterized protein n=1 Tax=Sphingomonas japonica TaxID=511662 RepID=A0ABX0TZ98_9SPHN|nr:hypothetical protein [Sphingomonas japonica]NIJ22492.1 hypothetical protein [Sphingomonas japonica]